MRRIQRLPRLGTWLTATAAIVVGLCSSDSFAQPASAVPRLAAVASDRAVTSPTPPQLDPLLEQLDLAIEFTSKRYLKANEHSPWQIFHGILALKRDFQLKLGDQKVNALEWIATSEPRFDNQPLLLKTAHGGKFHPFTRPWAFEGHPSQFLALMSQSDLPNDYSFKVGQEQITIADMVQNTMKEVNSKEEVTWVLWALQHHLKPDAQWTNQFGEPWSIEKLVQIESAAPVNGAACGGNHRLFALTRTRDKHLKLGGKLDGVWAQADLKIRQHLELARQLQNSDGSFSSKFYESPGLSNDLNIRFNTTGHTMEFLSIGLPDNRLNEPWVRNAAWVLARELIQSRQRQIDCGPLYHSLNSLMIYRERLRPRTPDSLATNPAEPAGVASTPKLEPKPVPLANVPIPIPQQNRLEVVAAPVLTEVRKSALPAKQTELSPLPVKSESTITPEVPIPSALAPTEGTESSAVKRPTSVPLVTTLKTIDPGRVVQLRPIVGESRPGLLPNVVAIPIADTLLPPGDPESFDTSAGTLKPRFGNPPPASRVTTSSVGSRTIGAVAAAPASAPIDDGPVSALTPENR